jgi:hypothetical protein
MAGIFQQSRALNALLASVLLVFLSALASGKFHYSDNVVLHYLGVLLEAPCALPSLIASWIFPNEHSAAIVVEAMVFSLFFNWGFIWLIMAGFASWRRGFRGSHQDE